MCCNTKCKNMFRIINAKLLHGNLNGIHINYCQNMYNRKLSIKNMKPHLSITQGNIVSTSVLLTVNAPVPFPQIVTWAIALFLLPRKRITWIVLHEITRNWIIITCTMLVSSNILCTHLPLKYLCSQNVFIECYST